MIKGIFLFVLLTTVCQAQSDEENEVARQVERLRQVMIRPDRLVLESLAAKELSYGHSSGMIEDKSAFVDEFVLGHSIFTAITLQDQNIRVVGNTAIVRHRLLGDSYNKSTPGKIDIIILMIWQKQKGQWKLLARQAAKIPPEYIKN
ncbi:MAG: nuclear transport factor 2 family protein [Cyclobacteriaceae bacterium]